VILGVAAFVLVSLLLTMFVWRSVGGTVPLQPKKYEVKALFDNASQLTRNADVRIAGVNVGKVTSIEARGLRTQATLAIDHQYAPLSRDARAILRQKTLLGETFVTVAPGNRGAGRMPDGGTLPVRQIGRTQPIDRVLGLLDKRTRRNIVEFMTNTGTMLDGRGQDFNDSLGNLAIGSRQLAATVRILDHQRGMVSSLVRDTGTVFQTIGDRRASIQELVRSGNLALSATAGRAAALTATVRATPPFLRELRATSTAVERTVRRAGPAVHEFRPLAPRFAPTLRAVRRASPELLRLLTGFDRLTPVARRGLLASARFTRSLIPLVEALAPAAAQVTPVVSYLSFYRKELVATMANTSSALGAGGPGATGPQVGYVRTLLPLGPETYTGQSKRVTTNRHNAYRAPGTLTDLARGLPASNCAGTAASNSAPPCRLQPPWTFSPRAKKRYYQHVRAARASGR
jgi:ABC-type transporter Mla subunit MlaD